MHISPRSPGSKSDFLKSFFFTNQTTGQTVLKNTFWAFVAEGVKKGTLLLLSILIARYLGASGYGRFSFALSFTMLFSVFSDLGLTMLATREIARAPELAQKYVSVVTTLKLLLGAATFLIIFTIAQLINKPDDVKILIYIFSGYVILNSVNDFFVALFRAYEEMQYEALFKIIQSVALLSLTLLSLLIGWPILMIVAAYMVSRIIGLLSILLILRQKRISLQFSLDGGFILDSLKESWPFALSTVFYIIYFSIDSIMISFMLGDREVGIYSASYTIITGLFYIPFLISIPFFPRMSKLLKGSNDQIRQLVSLWKRNLLYVLIPVCLLFYLGAELMIKLLYGEVYAESALIFRILLLALPFKFFSHPPGYSLSALNLHRTRVAIQGFTALFNIVTNYYFIPLYGIVAASITTFLSCFLLYALYQFYFSRFLRGRERL